LVPTLLLSASFSTDLKTLSEGLKSFELIKDNSKLSVFRGIVMFAFSLVIFIFG